MNGGGGRNGKGKTVEKEVDGPTSYAILNDPKAGEMEIEEEAERIAKGLLSVILTIGMYGVVTLHEGIL